MSTTLFFATIFYCLFKIKLFLTRYSYYLYISVFLVIYTKNLIFILFEIYKYIKFEIYNKYIKRQAIESKINYIV